MKEVKFRAWDKEDKKMFNIARFDFADNTVYSHLFACDGYLGESLKIMQYTGLKDKDGKEIYEGDIVHLPQHNHSGRVFLNVNHGWVVEGICMSVKVHNYKNIEVIGNIFQNGELINDSELSETD